MIKLTCDPNAHVTEFVYVNPKYIQSMTRVFQQTLIRVSEHATILNVIETPEQILELINNQTLAKKLESELYGE